ELRSGAIESGARAEAVGVREVRRGSEAYRATLIVLRNQIAAKPVVDHARAGTKRPRLSKQLSNNSGAVLQAICDSEVRSEIQIARFPPVCFAVGGSIQVPVENCIRHSILRHALALKIIAGGEVLVQRNCWSDLRPAGLIKRPEVLIA